MTAQDGLSAGTVTTRLTAEEKAAAYRAALAENARQMAACLAPPDVAQALGLDATTGPGTPCGGWRARVARLATGRPCVTCGTPAIKEATPC